MTDEYYELIYDKARSYGIAEGKAECILETLSDYGEVPLRIRRANSDPAKQRAAEPVVFAGPAGTYHRRLYEPDVSEMSQHSLYFSGSQNSVLSEIR